MSGYCPDCGNTFCLCADIEADKKRVISEPFTWSKESELESRLKEAEEHLRFTLEVAEYLFSQYFEMRKFVYGTFYFNLSYEVDSELIAKTKRAREYFKKYGGENV